MTTAPASTMRSLERAFDVLGVLEAARHPLRLSEVANRTDLHVATTQRILNVLVERGYAAKDEIGYIAGPAAVATAHAFLVNNQLSVVALPILQELADITGLTASLFVRVGFSRILIERVPGRAPLRYQLPIGERLPLHLGAGKTLAAWMPEDELRRLIDRTAPFTRVSGEEVTADALAEDLRRVKREGYTLSDSERVLNLAAISAPIRRSERNVLGALSITGSSSEFSADDRPRLIDEVRRAADAVAARHP